MARTPDFVTIGLHELMLLLNYRWAAVNSLDVGELGVVPHDAIVASINSQSEIKMTPSQLADLVHHMKEVIFERVAPAKQDFTIRNHNTIMRKLKSRVPNLFKELSSGEVVMIDYEVKDDV